MPKQSKSTVDFYDLKLTIPEHLLIYFENQLEAFDDHFDYQILAPKLKKGVLKINSNDFIHFLGYINSEALPELDRKRFCKDAESQMQQYLTKTVNADYRTHYQWCLTALKNLKWGRHKTSTD